MAKLAIVELSANYESDREKLINLLQVLDVDCREDKITFTFSIDGDDHFINISVDEDDLNHAIKKAKAEELAEIDSEEIEASSE